MTLVLVADDSATIRRLIQSRLAADGYEVLLADDGDAALQLARSRAPDLIVLDKVMPKLDGFEVVEALHASELTRDIPIVMLTDRADERDVITGLDLGVAEYMPKPFSPRELSTRVRRVLARSGSG